MTKTIKDLKLEEAQELLSFIGIEDADKFKDEFSNKYFTKETALSSDEIKSAVTGKRMNEVAGKLHKIVKILNPEISLNKFNEKTIEDNLPEIETLLTSKLTELETKAKAGNDKKLNDLETALQDKEKSVNSYKELAEKTANDFETFKTETFNLIKNKEVNRQLESAKSKLLWIDDVSDVIKTGYDALLGKKYKFELNDKEELQVLTIDGKPIPSKTRAGQMADPLEILDMELEANKLKKKNNATNQKVYIPLNKEKTGGRELPPQYLNRVKK